MSRILLLALVFSAATYGGEVTPVSVRRTSTVPPLMRGDAAATDTGTATERERERDECLRFIFGEWTPPLDAKAAGHPSFPPAESLPQGPGGRGWAVSDSTTGDTQLLLYPIFWPAGVRVRFPRKPRSPHDTVRGRATALVADGRVRSPEAEVMWWLAPCRR
jgi:hypothetical protein